MIQSYERKQEIMKMKIHINKMKASKDWTRPRDT